jgi:hypothetical protein
MVFDALMLAMMSVLMRLNAVKTSRGLVFPLPCMISSLFPCKYCEWYEECG